MHASQARDHAWRAAPVCSRHVRYAVYTSPCRAQLPQVLSHRDPVALLGISTARRDQLRVPIDAVLSYREDDALLLPQV